jgi:hypothetical protein
VLGSGTPPRELFDMLKAVEDELMPVLTDCGFTQQQKINAVEAALESLTEALGGDQAGSWQSGINAHGQYA